MTAFPSDLLRPTDSVLCLFSAAYKGEHDVAFVKEAGCTDVLLIDNDETKLQETAMQHEYGYKCCDAFDYIIFAASTDMKWDVVITDQWSNQDIEINVAYLDMLLRIARRHLILGYCKRNFNNCLIGPGRYMHRSDHLGGVYWRIIDK